MEFEIELVAMVGERQANGVVEQVELDQYQIFVVGPKLQEVRGVDRVLIGYVGKKAGAPINYLKVAAAFGPSVKMFTTMVRHGLLAKLKQRVAKAREAATEAEKLRDEAAALADEERSLAADESIAEAARLMAEAAINEANRELQEIDQQLAAEQLVDRKAFEPIVDAVQESARTSTTGSVSIDDLAESQNL